MGLFKDLFGSTSDSWAGANLSHDAYRLIWEVSGINIDSRGWMEQGALTERATALHSEITGAPLKRANAPTYAILILYALIEKSKQRGESVTVEAAKGGLATIVAAADKGDYGPYGRIPTEFAMRFAHLFE